MIARLMGLGDSEKGRVADIIMCRAFDDHRQMCRCLRDSFPGLDFPEEQVAGVWLDQATAPEEIPGATGAVRYAKKAGFKVGLVSDIWAPYYLGFLSACPELASMVDFAGLSYREGVRKPSAGLLERAVKALGVDPRRSWMVGDTYHNDLEPAVKMGMRTVWVLSRPEKEHRAMEGVLKGRLPRPDLIVDSVADLIGVDLISARNSQPETGIRDEGRGTGRFRLETK